MTLSDQLANTRRLLDLTQSLQSQHAGLAEQMELSALAAAHRTLRDECEKITKLRQTLEAEEKEQAELKDRLSIVAGKSLQVYLSEKMQPLANNRIGKSDQRILICSIPKSGTYLYTRLLELLGIEPTRLHLMTTHIVDYRYWSTDTINKDYNKTFIDIPIKDSVKLIEPGQFAASHIECTPQTRDVLKNFRILFLFREMRDVVVSHMRWATANNWGSEKTNIWRNMPEGPGKMLAYFDDLGEFFFQSRCYPVLKWMKQPGVLALSFEQIYGDYGKEKQSDTLVQILRHCNFDDTGIEKEELLTSLIGTQTETWSGSRTQREKYWSEEVERKFVELGGQDINEKLGFNRTTKC